MCTFVPAPALFVLWIPYARPFSGGDTMAVAVVVMVMAVVVTMLIAIMIVVTVGINWCLCGSKMT